jgi:hypothetical protein
MSCWRCALLVLLLAGPPLVAQVPDNVTKLLLAPAGESSPALKYQLLPDVPEQIPGNAVVHYYRAFSPEWYYRQNQVKTAQKLYAALQAAPSSLTGNELDWVRTTGQARELDLGAQSAYCDWQLNERVRSEGVEMLLPDMQSFRQLSVFLAVRTRLEIADRNFDKSVASLQTGLKLARDISQAPMLICALVGAGGAEIQLNQIETLMQTPGAPNLYWALTGLPRPFIDLRNALGGEKQLLYADMPLLKEIESAPFGPEQVKALTAQFEKMLSRRDQPERRLPPGKAGVLASALLAYPRAKHSLTEQGWTPATIETYPALQIVCIYYLHEFVQARDDMFKWAALPYWKAAPQMQSLEQALMVRTNDRANGPLLDLVSPGRHTVTSANRVERRIAALRTIEAIRLYAAAHKGNLPATLADVRAIPVPEDPMTGKAFSYSVRDNHFTLTGAAPRDDDPSLTIIYEVTISR